MKRTFKGGLRRLVSLGFSCAMASALSGCTGHRAPAYSLIQGGPQDRETATVARRALANLYPQRYRATQRAIITVRGKQFVCDGVLTASPETGHRLAVVSALGLVTELEVNTNRVGEVLRTTPLFREDWSRDFICTDLRRLFVPRADLNELGRLADGRFVLRAELKPDGGQIRYIFSPDGGSLREVEVERGGARVYLATVRRYRGFAGVGWEVPSEMEVTAPAYRLNLRMTELTTDAPAAAASATQ